MRSRFPAVLAVLVVFSSVLPSVADEHPDFAAVQNLFAKHCLDCHESKDPEANLVLESFETLMKGGESGPVLMAGKADESLLVKILEGRVEKDGKKIAMPPGKKKQLPADDIKLVRAWIDAGALPSSDTALVTRELIVPKIKPKNAPHDSVRAIDYSPAAKLIAIARYGAIELVSPTTFSVSRRLSGIAGMVNAVEFSGDGSLLFSGAGENSLFGEIKKWNVKDGSEVQSWRGHKDAIYALAISPDGKILASGSYDQKIVLWDSQTGQQVKTLSGHNGAVFGLAFRPDGKILASASADRTVKLWDVITGERRDTLSQSFKEVHAVAFSPDGKRLFAGGVDNRIRIWQISSNAVETSNPLLESRFAHEGAILRLVVSDDGKTLLSSADDRSVKFWELPALKERFVLAEQSDWCTGLAFFSQNQKVMIGRMDGSTAVYSVLSGKAISSKLVTQFSENLKDSQ